MMQVKVRSCTDVLTAVYAKKNAMVSREPMTMVYLRPRILVLHMYPAKMGPKIPLTLVRA